MDQLASQQVNSQNMVEQLKFYSMLGDQPSTPTNQFPDNKNPFVYPGACIPLPGMNPPFGYTDPRIQYGLHYGKMTNAVNSQVLGPAESPSLTMFFGMPLDPMDFESVRNFKGLSSDVVPQNNNTAPVAVQKTSFDPFAALYDVREEKPSTSTIPPPCNKPEQPRVDSPTPSRKSAGYVKRPMNAFMIWSQEERKKYVLQFPDTHNSEISKVLGPRWQRMSPVDKLPYFAEQNRLAKLHSENYPDYHYRPKRKSIGAMKREVE